MNKDRLEAIRQFNSGATKTENFQEWNTESHSHVQELLEYVDKLEKELISETERLAEVAASNGKDAEDLEDDLRLARTKIAELEESSNWHTAMAPRNMDVLCDKSGEWFRGHRDIRGQWWRRRNGEIIYERSESPDKWRKIEGTR